MKKWQATWPYILVLIFLYYICPLLFPILPLDDLTLKSLSISHLLIYQPLLILFLSMLYSGKHDFYWLMPIVVGLLFWPVDVLVYPNAEGAEAYVLPYALISLVGCLIGHGFYSLKKRRTKT